MSDSIRHIFTRSCPILKRLPYPQEGARLIKINSGRSGAQGELALLRQIRSRAAKRSSGGLSLGIGDDCALLRLRPGEELAVTTDLSIAGRHFRLDWHQPESVGHRALARGLSDLAAMGARPVAAFLSLGLPRGLTQSAGRCPAWVTRFLDGLLTLAETCNVPLAGGDLAESRVAVADIVLAGAVPRGKALLRSGARPGDLLYVTGTLGGAAAGLARLAELAKHGAERRTALKGKSLSCAVSGTDSARSSAQNAADPGQSPPIIPKGLAGLLAPHLYPEPRLAQGLWLVRHGLATAALDLSDGLSTDLAHLCEESGVAAEVTAAALPLHPGATLEQALHGGEDYELLFTAPAAARLPRQISGVRITKIGLIAKARPGRPTMTLVSDRGAKPLKKQGWEHFC
jgi:thiamine-monophosphate kinase